MTVFISKASEATTQKPKPRLVIAAFVLIIGTLVGCGPEVANESITDDSGSVTAGDIEPGAGGQPVQEGNDLDDDSLMKDETPNENRGTSADSDVASGANAADTNVSMTADGNEAWVITNVEGTVGLENAQEGTDEDSMTDAPNPAVTLTVGQRYRFNNALYDVHVLQFRDGEGNVLLGQGQGEAQGSFAGDAEVDPVISDNALTFTLTESLAQEIADYHAQGNQAMTGEVRTASTAR